MKFNLRCPDASTPSHVGITVTAIIHYQKLIFTLMRILKSVQLGLKRSRWILARDIPLFSSKIEVALENSSKLISSTCTFRSSSVHRRSKTCTEVYGDLERGNELAIDFCRSSEKICNLLIWSLSWLCGGTEDEESS